MDCSLRVDASKEGVPAQEDVYKKAVLSQINKDLYAVFLAWKAKLDPNESSGSLNKHRIQSIRAIKLESFDTGVCAFRDASNAVFAYARIPAAETEALQKTDRNRKKEWQTAVNNAFAKLTKYFEGECLRNCFPQTQYLSERLLRNYASPDEGMRKLIQTCGVIDMFASRDGTLCMYMKDPQNMKPEFLARCMMTDEEYSLFECDKLLRDFDRLAGFATSSKEPPFGEIRIIARHDSQKVTKLVADIIGKFKSSASDMKTAITHHYNGWPITPDIIKYFEDAASLPHSEIEAVAISRAQ